jgi:hypothetical protein
MGLAQTACTIQQIRPTSLRLRYPHGFVEHDGRSHSGFALSRCKQDMASSRFESGSGIDERSSLRLNHNRYRGHRSLQLDICMARGPDRYVPCMTN